MKILKNNIAVVDNEEGFILAGALMVMVVLVLLGVASTNTTNIEFQISSYDRTEKEVFYDQETCLATAKLNSNTWLTPGFISSPNSNAAFPPAGNDADLDNINDLSEVNDANNITLASYEARHLTTTPFTAGDNNLSNLANDIPRLTHTDKPLPGSGYSQTDFEIRQYAITCQPPDATQRVVLQEGIYKIFNKFSG